MVCLTAISCDALFSLRIELYTFFQFRPSLMKSRKLNGSGGGAMSTVFFELMLDFSVIICFQLRWDVSWVDQVLSGEQTYHLFEVL